MNKCYYAFILAFLVPACIGIFPQATIAQSISNENRDTINTQFGKKTSTGFWIHEKTAELNIPRMGPFIHLNKGAIATVDTSNFLVSHDDGATWKAFPLFKDSSKFFIRPERALIKTKKGTLILAFANDKERAKWNWSKDTHDSPEAELPTYAMYSKDNGKSWSQPQMLHKDWTGAIRDIIETKDGQVVFSSMMMRHNPGHHAVVTYNSSNEGKTWTRSNIIDLGGVGDHDGVTESTLEQMGDGSLKMLLRTNWGYFWETTSNNKGLTWENVKSTPIDASSSPGILKRLKSGRLVLVWNRYYPQGKKSYPLRGGDYNFSAAPVSMHREEISIMFSDDGRHWSKPVVIGKTTEPKTQIAYPYLFEKKPGELWISFAFSKLRFSLQEEDFIQKIKAPVIVGKAPTNEATLIRLASGTVKMFYINRPGKADKMMSISSTDNGDSWQEPIVEFELPGEAYYANQVMQDRNGTIHCVFHIFKPGPLGYRGRHLDLWYTSMKPGGTWSQPKMINEGYVGSLRGFIELKNGNFIIPMTESDTARANKPGSGMVDHGLFQVMTLNSTDLGQTWTRSLTTLKIPIESSWVTRYGAIEPHAIEMNDGKIWMLIRTNKGFLYESFSDNDGTTWSAPTQSSFISSDSPANTVRLADGNIILLWNSNQRYDDKRSYAAGGREVLHAAISKDDGKTWNGFREVMTTINSKTPVTRGDRGTAYPSAIELPNGNVLMVSGQGDDASLVMFSPGWLEEKKQEDQLDNLQRWTMHGSNPDDAVWNFPMLKKGTLAIKVMANSNISIGLTDHFSVASDSLSMKVSPIHFTIDKTISTEKETTIRVSWDAVNNKVSASVDGKKIKLVSSDISKNNFGLNYLRVTSFLNHPIKISSVLVEGS